MPSYDSFAIVAVLAFVAPVLRGLLPQLLVPAIVLEIAFGLLVGPHGLHLARVDVPVRVFSDVGLAMLLFLAGLEIDLDRLRGRVLRLAGAGFALSFVLGLGAGGLAALAGVSESPLLIAIILVATSLSVIIVPLKDAHETATEFGQLVIAAASVAEFGALILLSLFFSTQREGLETEALHLGLFAIVAVALGFDVARGGLRGGRLTPILDRLADTTAQIRVRADFALVAVAVWLAWVLGLEAILAAFTAGVIRGLWRERQAPQVRSRLEAASFGIFVPFFFITSGMQFDVGALFSSAGTVLRMPAFLLAILLVRSAPALLYRRMMGGRPMVAAGLLQATSLTFVVVAAQVGQRLHLIGGATAAALIGAGLLSVVLFPGTALALLRGSRAAGPGAAPATAAGDSLG
jgi:Kef-type K+ transport system membrane component KefB